MVVYSNIGVLIFPLLLSLHEGFLTSKQVLYFEQRHGVHKGMRIWLIMWLITCVLTLFSQTVGLGLLLKRKFGFEFWCSKLIFLLGWTVNGKSQVSYKISSLMVFLLIISEMKKNWRHFKIQNLSPCFAF